MNKLKSIKKTHGFEHLVSAVIFSEVQLVTPLKKSCLRTWIYLFSPCLCVCILAKDYLIAVEHLIAAKLPPPPYVCVSVAEGSLIAVEHLMSTTHFETFTQVNNE